MTPGDNKPNIKASNGGNTFDLLSNKTRVITTTLNQMEWNPFLDTHNNGLEGVRRFSIENAPQSNAKLKF